MTQTEAEDLAARWTAAWNAHDLDRILALYTEDFEMSSPYIVQIAGDPGGRLRGHQAVGAYWRKAFEKYPDLHFEPLQVYAGAASLVFTYRSIGGRLAAEMFEVDDAGLIRRAAAHYV